MNTPQQVPDTETMEEDDPLVPPKVVNLLMHTYEGNDRPKMDPKFGYVYLLTAYDPLITLDALETSDDHYRRHIVYGAQDYSSAKDDIYGVHSWLKDLFAEREQLPRDKNRRRHMVLWPLDGGDPDIKLCYRDYVYHIHERCFERKRLPNHKALWRHIVHIMDHLCATFTRPLKPERDQEYALRCCRVPNLKDAKVLLQEYEVLCPYAWEGSFAVVTTSSSPIDDDVIMLTSTTTTTTKQTDDVLNMPITLDDVKDLFRECGIPLKKNNNITGDNPMAYLSNHVDVDEESEERMKEILVEEEADTQAGIQQQQQQDDDYGYSWSKLVGLDCKRKSSLEEESPETLRKRRYRELIRKRKEESEESYTLCGFQTRIANRERYIEEMTTLREQRYPSTRYQGHQALICGPTD